MSNITLFNFEGAAVRAMQIDGEPYVVGKDVAEALGYSDTTNAIKQHCKGGAKHHPLPTGGGVQEMRVLSEPDVLRLIVNSKLPAAVRFERWVFEDVLPSIRKTGGYSVNLADPAQLRQVLLGYTEKVIALESQVSVMEPKVEALNRIALADGSMCLTDAAKHLQVQPKWLFRWLQEHQWIYRRAGGSGFIGYQSRIQVGYLEHKVSTVERSDGSTKATEQVRVMAKGLAKLAEMLSSKEVA
ncbi:phage antirepressor KilAC domain-containing protein [Variovorax boronicumulans]|uniref:phage antirepressor KilAC domain-containing protein n=1 Tax=Variovorax boronicumulans TaxID=436515 RepID=UPI000782298F|nr:phage antirepressor [Variovorax boronicumulans]